MSKLLEALGKLQVQNDNHWTAEGLPRLETVRFIAGDQSISRDDITKAAPEFTRQNLAKASEQAASGSAEQTPPVPPPVPPPEQTPASSEQASGQETMFDPSSLTSEQLDVVIVQERNKLTQIKNYLEQGRVAYEQQQKVVDDLINLRHASEANVNPSHTIQAYLQFEQKKAQEEAEKRELLDASGITVETLKELLPKLSPLDASFKKK